MPLLSQANLDFWEENGYVIVRNAVPRENAERAEQACLLYTSPSPRDKRQSRMPSSA